MSQTAKYSIATDSETGQGINEAYESDRRRMVSEGKRPRSLNQFILDLIRIGLREREIQEMIR